MSNQVNEVDNWLECDDNFSPLDDNELGCALPPMDNVVLQTMETTVSAARIAQQEVEVGCDELLSAAIEEDTEEVAADATTPNYFEDFGDAVIDVEIGANTDISKKAEDATDLAQVSSASRLQQEAFHQRVKVNTGSVNKKRPRDEAVVAKGPKAKRPRTKSKRSATQTRLVVPNVGDTNPFIAYEVPPALECEEASTTEVDNQAGLQNEELEDIGGTRAQVSGDFLSLGGTIDFALANCQESEVAPLFETLLPALSEYSTAPGHVQVFHDGANAGRIANLNVFDDGTATAVRDMDAAEAQVRDELTAGVHNSETEERGLGSPMSLSSFEGEEDSSKHMEGIQDGSKVIDTIREARENGESYGQSLLTEDHVARLVTLTRENQSRNPVLRRMNRNAKTLISHMVQSSLVRDNVESTLNLNDWNLRKLTTLRNSNPALYQWAVKRFKVGKHGWLVRRRKYITKFEGDRDPEHTMADLWYIPGIQSL